jgi:hypothetical protein
MVVMGISPGIGIDDEPLKGVYLLQLKPDDILKCHRSFSTPHLSFFPLEGRIRISAKGELRPPF